MKKIYLIKCSNEKVEFVSAVVTTKKVAETICKLRNLQNEIENNEFRYSYDETSIIWKSTDLEYLQNKINEITEEKSKELPF